MSIKEVNLEKLEKLSLIRIEEGDKKKIEEDIIKILKFFEKINELDLENVTPMFHPVESGKLRDDIVEDPMGSKRALMNVSTKEGSYIKGPSVVT
jgi:aspartyl-tRNA(Asn)/glutamyl-tRNA(Gln) amidotransferase subunit C